MVIKVVLSGRGTGCGVLTILIFEAQTCRGSRIVWHGGERAAVTFDLQVEADSQTVRERRSACVCVCVCQLRPLICSHVAKRVLFLSLLSRPSARLIRAAGRSRKGFLPFPSPPSPR